MHYVLKRSIFPPNYPKMPQAEFVLPLSKVCGRAWFQWAFLRISTIFVSTSKECTFHQKFGFIMSNIWFEISFHNSFRKCSLCKNVKKSILNKQVSNKLASQMVFFSQWSDIQKGYSKTRDYSVKNDFSVVADAHAHPRDTQGPFLHPHEERSVKEICRTIREKVRVMVEEVGGWVCFSPELVWGWQS